MITVLALGFFIGMQHALEADHVGAVASMAARESSPRRLIFQGAVWGLGHTVTLLALGGLLIALGTAVPAETAALLEALVGVMLIGLGVHVLYGLLRDRIHFHSHHHTDGQHHIHAHSHRHSNDHTAPEAHEHAHGFPARALVVGLMHGLAGSAALIVLAAGAFHSPVMAFSYIGLFGLGSILGMAALSGLIAIPLALTAKWLTWANSGLQAIIGTGTAAVGVLILTETVPLI